MTAPEPRIHDAIGQLDHRVGLVVDAEESQQGPRPGPELDREALRLGHARSG